MARSDTGCLGKEIGKVFETAKIVMDGKFTLEEAMEFLEGIDGALVGIVEEELVDRGVVGVDRWLRDLNHLHQASGDSGVEP
jgi:hypothetical protein